MQHYGAQQKQVCQFLGAAAQHLLWQSFQMLLQKHLKQGWTNVDHCDSRLQCSTFMLMQLPLCLS